MAGGSVGGWTSYLELKTEPEGFKTATSLISDLTKQLKSLKKEAGDLGNMKIKISIQNPMDDELKQFKEKKERLSKDQRQILMSYRNEMELSKEKKAENKDKENEERLKQKRHSDTVKGVDDTLKFFGTTLKWTAGIILGFVGTLGALLVKNASENTNTSFNAKSMNMDPFKYMALQQVGKVYGNSEDAFSKALSFVREFKTNPTLYGNLDSQKAIGLFTGTGTKVDKNFFNMKEEDMTKTIINNAIKKYTEAQKKGDYAQMSNVSQFVSSNFGQEMLNTMLGMIGRNVYDVQSAQGYIEGGLVKPNFKASNDFNFLSNDVMSKLQNQLNVFLTEIEESLLNPLTLVNNWLRDNKENIASFGKDLIDFMSGIIDFIGGLSNMNMESMVKGAGKLNLARDRAIYGKENLDKAKTFGMVDEKESGYDFKFNPKVNDMTAIMSKAPLDPKGNMAWVLKNLESMRNEATKMTNSIGDIMINDAISSAQGNLEKAKQNVLKLFNDPSFKRNLEPGNLPDASKQKIEQLKWQSSFMQNQKQPDNIINVDLKMDYGSTRIQQTVRQQTVKNTANMSQWNRVGGPSV